MAKTKDADVDEVLEATTKASTKKKEEASHAGKILVLMTHPFRRYDIIGYTFTREQPFKLMDEEDANHLFKVHRDGHFRPATPQEVKDYFSE